MKVASVSLLLLWFRPMSSTRVAMASTVVRPGLKPNCRRERVFEHSRWFIKRLCIKCSKILPGIGSRDMGLRSETFVEFFILGMGITIASFHWEGILPEEILKLHKNVNSDIIIVRASLMSQELRPGMPLDF